LVSPTSGCREEAVRDLQGALLNILVRAVDGIARLKSHDRAPALLVKDAARVGGIEPVRLIFPMLGTLQQADLPGEIDLPGFEEAPDARMGRIGRREDQARLALLIRAILVLQIEQAERAPLRIGQSDGLPLGEPIGFRARHRERDRDRPGQAIG
jgi:hypothetical protein